MNLVSGISASALKEISLFFIKDAPVQIIDITITIAIVVYTLEGGRAWARRWHGQLLARAPKEQKGMSIT